MEPGPVEALPAPPAPFVRVAPRFDPPDVLWYFGTIAATVAAYAVIGENGSQHRGLWIFLVSLAFVAGAAGLCALSLAVRRWVPAGVMATAAVVLFPGVVVGFEELVGVWPKHPENTSPWHDFVGTFFSVALVTALVGLAVFWVVRFGFVMLPVALTTLLAVQLLLPALITDPGVSAHVTTLLATGSAFVVAGMLLDARGHRSAAFWWHVVGLLAVAEGLAYYAAANVLVAFVPGDAHRHAWAWIAMIVLGAVLVVTSFPVRRATWAVFGVVGLYAPVLHYLDDATGSWELGLLMVVVGVALVAVGVFLDAAGNSWPQRLARPVMRRPT